MNRRAPRAAFSLVEMMVAMTFGLSIMGVLATALSRVMATNASAAEHWNDLNTLGELSRQFRRDVRGATAASLAAKEGSPAVLTLAESDGSKVTYTLDGGDSGGALRRLKSAEGQGDSHQEYAFSGFRMQRFFVSADGREVRLAIAHVSVGADGPRTSGRTFELISLIAHLAPDNDTAKSTPKAQDEE